MGASVYVYDSTNSYKYYNEAKNRELGEEQQLIVVSVMLKDEKLILVCPGLKNDMYVGGFHLVKESTWTDKQKYGIPFNKLCVSGRYIYKKRFLGKIKLLRIDRYIVRDDSKPRINIETILYDLSRNRLNLLSDSPSSNSVTHE